MMTYLSQIPHPPSVCLLTGGIAPMLAAADIKTLYGKLWARVKERNLRYYEMYPGDVDVVKRIVRALLRKPAVLPSGGTLTARRFLQLGIMLGGSPSAFASMHSFLSEAFIINPMQLGNDRKGIAANYNQQRDDEEEAIEFHRAFLKRIDSDQSFDDHPIYFLLHESIYADGALKSPTRWAAHRALENILIPSSSDFDYNKTSSPGERKPTLFFGEMVFPWMTEDYAELSGTGMTSLANSLASKIDWEPLFDTLQMRKILGDASTKSGEESIIDDDRVVTGINSRAAAAVYHDDMYVDFDESLAVASRGNPLERCKVWITNEYQHSGLRDDGAHIFSKLHGMATGSINTPS